MSVVSLRGAIPPARFDVGQPWNRVRWEEAPAVDGPWVVLETQLLPTLDPDPSRPSSHDLTTELATMAGSGWYRLTWLDATGDESTPTDPVTFGAATLGEEVLAAVESLMAYVLRAGGFVEGRGGRRVEHFDANTNPTLARATEVSSREADAVANEFPAADEPDAVSVAALRSAMTLETGRDNFDADRVRAWREQLSDRLKALTAAGATGGGSGGGSGSGRDLGPRWSFGPGDGARAEGSECPVVPCSPDARRRREW